jgi:hypothetical protein
MLQGTLMHIRVSLFLKPPCFKRPCNMVPRPNPATRLLVNNNGGVHCKGWAWSWL